MKKISWDQYDKQTSLLSIRILPVIDDDTMVINNYDYEVLYNNVESSRFYMPRNWRAIHAG